MKINFPTNISRSHFAYYSSTGSTNGGQIRTAVTLGFVEIGFHGHNVMWLDNKKTHESYCYEGLNTAARPYRTMQECEYSVLMFHLNRMLYQQAETLLEKTVDQIITGKEEV